MQLWHRPLSELRSVPGGQRHSFIVAFRVKEALQTQLDAAVLLSPLVVKWVPQLVHPTLPELALKVESAQLSQTSPSNPFPAGHWHWLAVSSLTKVVLRRAEVVAKRRTKRVSLGKWLVFSSSQGSLAHLQTQSDELVRWVASVIDPARKDSQEEHAARE